MTIGYNSRTQTPQNTSATILALKKGENPNFTSKQRELEYRKGKEEGIRRGDRRRHFGSPGGGGREGGPLERRLRRRRGRWW